VGSEVVLLQARPITTLQEQLIEPVSVPVEVPPARPSTRRSLEH
jgi:hypothetical protein